MQTKNIRDLSSLSSSTLDDIKFITVENENEYIDKSKKIFYKISSVKEDEDSLSANLHQKELLLPDLLRITTNPKESNEADIIWNLNKLCKIENLKYNRGGVIIDNGPDDSKPSGPFTGTIKFSTDKINLSAYFKNSKVTNVLEWDVPKDQYSEDGSQNYQVFNASQLSTFKTNLPGLKYGNHFFERCKITHWDNDLPDLVEGEAMFAGNSGLRSVECSLPSLVKCGGKQEWGGKEGMFEGNANLRTVHLKTPKLIDATRMFSWCGSLYDVSLDWGNIVYGGRMFYWNRGLTVDIVQDLPYLIQTWRMFSESRIRSFTGVLTSCTFYSWEMFSCNPNLRFIETDMRNATATHWLCSGGNTHFKRWTGRLDSLRLGHFMFEDASSMEIFEGNLPSLTGGDKMFKGCALNLESVKRIAETIQDLNPKLESGELVQSSDDTLHIDIGINIELQGNPEIETAINLILSKGWTVGTTYRSPQYTD